MTPSSRTFGCRNRQSLSSDQEWMGLLVSGAITALTLVVAFSLLALDFEYFWMVFVVGFGVVLPTTLGVVTHPRTKNEDETPREGENNRTPLEELRLRYAQGELTEAEFERRVEHLLETEDEEQFRMIER